MKKEEKPIMSYEDYKNLVERQIKTHDFRERVFQDNIVRPFLQTVFPELDIEPVDVKTQSKIHEYEQYCGTTMVDNKSIFGTPDLCIAKEWYWNNRDVDVDYRGVVEIKSPFLDKITGISPNKYNSHTLGEISQYLRAEKNSKIILTDAITWAFYSKEYSKENEINPIIEPICLGKLEKKYKRGHNNRLVLEKDNGGNPIIDIIFNEDESIFEKLVIELKNFIYN